MNGKGDRDRVKDFKSFNKNYQEINWGHKKVPNPACSKCQGAGWLWWYELDSYRTGPAIETGQDDTQYLCDECFPVD